MLDELYNKLFAITESIKPINEQEDEEDDDDLEKEEEEFEEEKEDEIGEEDENPDAEPEEEMTVDDEESAEEDFEAAEGSEGIDEPELGGGVPNAEETGTEPEAEPEEESEEAQIEKQYLGKKDDDTYYYLNKIEGGWNVTDAEGKIVYPLKGEAPEVPENDVVGFIIQAQRDLELEEISGDIFKRYFEPALEEEEEVRDEEAGIEYEGEGEEEGGEEEIDLKDEAPLADEFGMEEEKPMTIERKLKEWKEGSTFTLGDKTYKLISKKDKGDHILYRAERQGGLHDGEIEEIPVSKPKTNEAKYVVYYRNIDSGERGEFKPVEATSEKDAYAKAEARLIRDIGEENAKYFEMTGIRVEGEDDTPERKTFPSEGPKRTPHPAQARFGAKTSNLSKRQMTQRRDVFGESKQFSSPSSGTGSDSSGPALNESVSELIHEVPGIDEVDQMVLEWAVGEGIIPDKFPDPFTMLMELDKVVDVTDDEQEVEEVDALIDAMHEGGNYFESVMLLQIYYLKKILLPRAHDAYAGKKRMKESKSLYCKNCDHVISKRAYDKYGGLCGGCYSEKGEEDKPMKCKKCGREIKNERGKDGYCDSCGKDEGVDESKVNEIVELKFVVWAVGNSPRAEGKREKETIQARSMKDAVTAFAGKEVGYVRGRGSKNDIAVYMAEDGVGTYKLYRTLSTDESKVNELKRSGVELKLKKNSETGEWMVVYYENGKRNEEKTYYTDDKEDAAKTMADIQKRVDKGDKGYTTESKMNEAKFIFDRHSFNVELTEDNENGITINVNDKQKFNFTPHFANLYRDEKGQISEDSLVELAKSALSNLSEEYFEELAKGAIEQGVEDEENIKGPEEPEPNIEDEPVEESKNAMSENFKGIYEDVIPNDSGPEDTSRKQTVEKNIYDIIVNAKRPLTAREVITAAGRDVKTGAREQFGNILNIFSEEGILKKEKDSTSKSLRFVYSVGKKPFKKLSEIFKSRKNYWEKYRAKVDEEEKKALALFKKAFKGKYRTYNESFPVIYGIFGGKESTLTMANPKAGYEEYEFALHDRKKSKIYFWEDRDYNQLIKKIQTGKPDHETEMKKAEEFDLDKFSEERRDFDKWVKENEPVEESKNMKKKNESIIPNDEDSEEKKIEKLTEAVSYSYDDGDYTYTLIMSEKGKPTFSIDKEGLTLISGEYSGAGVTSYEIVEEETLVNALVDILSTVGEKKGYLDKDENEGPNEEVEESKTDKQDAVFDMMSKHFSK